MAYLLDIALANLIVATLLALLAALAGLWGRRPALTHALWVLVLVKLITPPLFHYPISWPAPPEPIAQMKPMVEANELPVKAMEQDVPDFVPPVELDMPADPVPELIECEVVAPEIVPVERAPVIRVVVPEAMAAAAPSWAWLELVTYAWLAGSCGWLILAFWRLWRFQRLLRFAEPAPAAVQTLANELAECLRVRCPEVCVIPGNVSPMLWALGRTPRLLVPARLLERLGANQLTTLLAHELAHWRRRDDRIRWLELAVLALYWWCPPVWWARRELHQAEEECCDAWVVSILPDSAKDYALALVETVDFLSGAPALPPLASGLGRVRLLKRRLTMILQGKTPRALTFTGLLGVAGVGLLVLPLVFSRAQEPNARQPNDREEKKADRKKGGDGEGERPGGRDQERDEVGRLQDEIQKRQQELQQRMVELQKIVQRLQQLEGGAGRPPGGQGQQGQRGQQGQDGPNNQGGGGGRPGQPGQPGGGPMPPPGGGFGGGQPGGFPGGHVEKRLNELERKLDILLQEVRGLRGEGKPGVRLPGGKAPGRPVDRDNPAPTPRPKEGGGDKPRPGAGDVPRPKEGGGDRPRPEAVPRPEGQQNPPGVQPPRPRGENVDPAPSDAPKR